MASAPTAASVPPPELALALSGVTLAGIGSAFWGVLAGSVALMVQHYRSRAQP